MSKSEDNFMKITSGVFVAASIIFIIFLSIEFNKYNNCKQNESVLCPTFRCPDNEAAFRTDENGQTQRSL